MHLIPNIIRRIIFFTLLFFYFSATGICQIAGYQSGTLFYQLNTSHGLSDNYINDMCTDKNGNLWIASGEGLNMYNGKTVVRFFRQKYPQLQNDYITQLVCDEKNRIWVMSDDGNVTVIDEYRQFHRVGLYKNKTFIPSQHIVFTASSGVILWANGEHFVFNASTDFSVTDSLTLKNFTQLSIKGSDIFSKEKINQVRPFDEERYLFNTGSFFYTVNYKKGVVESRHAFTGLTLLTTWAGNSMLAYNNTALRLQVIDLATNASTYPFDVITDQHGNKLIAKVTNARWINKGQLLLTTRTDGMYIYTAAPKQLYNYRHNAADPGTIVNNSPFIITTDSTGWVFVGASPNGISYFKSNAVIGQQSVFLDNAGNSYDGHISSIATQDSDTYYIGVSNNLLQWQRSTNKITFVNHVNNNLVELKKKGVSYITFDKEKNLWISMPGSGIYVLDKKYKLLKFMMYDSAKSGSIPSAFIRHMQIGPDGYMWLSTRKGICRVNTNTFKVDLMSNTLLKELRSEICSRTWFDDSNNIWIATESKGAWRYSLHNGLVRKYTKENGLLTNEVFCFNKDRFENMYIGTGKGLVILFKNGQKKTITIADGLLNKRIEALIRDKNDRMWIGNDVALACFNITDTSLKVFDERYGLSVQGFRINSYWQNTDDELLWGTERGLQYFYPDNLLQQKINLVASVNQVETRDIIASLTNNGTFRLSASDNYVTFYFTSIDYSKHLRTFYEYKLEGLDEKWIQVTDQNSVRYNLLPPGNYIFKLRVSNDNVNWQTANNEVAIIVATPLYKTWFFKLLSLIIALIAILFVVNYFRKKQIEKRSILETELVINYFASQINSRYNTDELLWDVAKNLIGKLGFEDCMIYLWDDDRTVLIQKAGYGTKGSMPAIKSKEGYDIPGGKGIVGAAVENRQAVLVNDTSKDKRYFTADGKIMLSELCVPLLHGNEVLGAINIEHHQKNFFTGKHLQMLSTIAVLCANQIQRIRAEEEKQKATIELLKNKQKAAESRLQSLRLQMNPHFLFNSLNSVQQMILANEEMVATKYLSRFSKLLRTILIHSDKEFISLREEIEIIKLYVELESIRFKDAFRFIFYCDEAIDTEEVRIPTLLLQPFVENAIWHGLMHKETERLLQVKFTESDDGITCIIEDNGVGRKNAATRDVADNVKQHTGKGIAVSIERLKALKTPDGREGSIEITDMRDETGNALGTRVEINFPV